MISKRTEMVRLVQDRQDSAWFEPKVPHTQKSVWTHPIELLGDVDHVESHFGLFGDSVSVGAR